MAIANPVQAPLTNIVRATPAQRLATFTKNESSIYNKFSPYDGSTGGIGFSQPFIYTKLTDSNFSKNLTKYDSQAFPIGSTVRDVQRVGKFMLSGTGLLYVGKQYLLQKQNAFNETRIYNPLSVIGATGKAATLGLMDRPKRYIESGGTLLGTFMNALKGTVGIQIDEQRVSGTAEGLEGNGPFSRYISLARGTGTNTGKYAGVVRYETAMAASTKFESLWYGTKPKGQSLFSKLASTFSNLIPSTNPTGMGTGNNGTAWIYRPEYIKGQLGPYFTFLQENPTNLLGMDITNTPVSTRSQFYNGTKISISKSSETLPASYFHKYYPKNEIGEDAKIYAGSADITNGTVGGINPSPAGIAPDGLLDKMIKTISALPPNTPPQQLMGQHMYSEVKDYNNPSQTKYPVYTDIPDSKNRKQTFQQAMVSKFISWNANSFAGASGSNQHDEYNALKPIKGKKGEVPTEIRKEEANQSKDIIFFYFFDLINEVYLPFRATLTGISDQHSADWEDITYMGRADKLFVYKGFSRDVNLSFTVYANSIKELVPMWERLNYLVGLVRPSGYTGKAIITNTDTSSTTGLESQFIYPPMITLRVGDLYHDQPCVISSISMTVPEDTNWETLRSDERYDYQSSPLKNIKVEGVSSRQLPLKVDVSMTLKLMEKSQSVTWGNHFGHNAALDEKNPPRPEPPKIEPSRPIQAPQLSSQNLIMQNNEIVEQENFVSNVSLGLGNNNTFTPTP